MTTLTDHTSIYHPVEHAIISRWLKTPALVSVVGITLEEEYDKLVFPDDEDEAFTGISWEESDHIRLREPQDGGYVGLGDIENAVARLVLEGIQGRLPQWGTGDGQGGIYLARSITPKTPRKVDTFPQHLCTINWANSGPGFSWPEAYYVTYLPLYDKFVVTASQDSAELYGYEDLAIGHFEADIEVTDGSKQVLLDWWRHHGDNYRETPWEELFSTGLLDETEVYSLRDEIWPEKTDDETAIDTK